MAFHADVDTYRKQFRGIWVQFVSRLELILKRWLALSDVAEEYESLFDFLGKGSVSDYLFAQGESISEGEGHHSYS